MTAFRAPVPGNVYSEKRCGACPVLPSGSFTGQLLFLY